MAGENQTGGAGSTENTPKLVEVEIDGKKVKVEEGVEAFLMKDKDYRQKTAALAEEKRQLEATKTNFQAQIEASQALTEFLSQNDKAARVLELLAIGNTAEAKKILDDDAEEGNGKIAFLEKKVLELEGKFKTKQANDTASAQRTAEYAEAKRRAQEEFGLDLDKYYPKMVERGMKDKNPFIPWLLSVALDDLKIKAKEEGRSEGSKEALEELTNKLNNTPAMSSGYGQKSAGGFKNTQEAVSAAYKRLLEEKARGT